MPLRALRQLSGGSSPAGLGQPRAIRLARLLDCGEGGHPKIDLASDTCEPQGIGALVAQALECEVRCHVRP
jgi:hypothetical protein